MVLDPRLVAGMAAARHVYPTTRPSQLKPLVDGVIAGRRTDLPDELQFVAAAVDAANARIELAAHIPTVPTDRPAMTETAVGDIVPGDMVWDSDTRYFQFVIATPREADGLRLCYEGGLTSGLFDLRDQLCVAYRTAEADAWNRARSTEATTAGSLADIQHPDSGAGDRQIDPGEAA